MIALERVTVARGGRVALGPIDLRVRRGRITAIIGPSGAGKSTLIAALAGAPITSGAVLCDGVALASRAPREWARTRAVLAQSAERPFAFALSDFVALGRLPHGDREHPRAREIVERSMRWAGLDPGRFAQRTVDTLSGGELQRAQLARVRAQLHGEGPRWLLLDEPTTHLDLPLQHALLERCASLRDEGVGVVLVLHELSLALQWADELLLLRGGRALAQRAASEVTSEDLTECFGARLAVVRDAASGLSMVTVARGASTAAANPQRQQGETHDDRSDDHR
jgi:iron complex transport system ATP-binding protein